jgi:hypothetical protein
MRLFAPVLAVPLLLLGAGCATYQDDLARGERAFEASEHERALAVFRALEPDLGRLSVSERAHYAYLRGMTDFRIGYKAESRHWLSLAAALEQATPGSLPPEWAKRLGESLKELNEEVYTAGVESLANSAAPSKGKGDDEAPGKSPSKKEDSDSPTTPSRPPE